MIKFFKSAKTMCALSMVFIFPMFYYNVKVLTIIAESGTGKWDHDVDNFLNGFSGVMGVVNGIGTGMLTCGVTCYVAALPSKGNYGKNFGILFTIWAIIGYLTEHFVVADFTLLQFGIMCFALSLLFLSLGNTRGEKRMLAVIGTEPDGNIFKNMSNLILLLPSAFTAAYAIGYFTILMDIADDGNVPTFGMEGQTIKYIFLTFGGVGPIFFGALYDVKKELIIAVIKILIAVVTLLAMFAYNSDYPRILLVAALLLALTCVATISHTLALIRDTYNRNEIGGICAFWVFHQYGHLFFYTFYYGLNRNFWITTIILLVLSLVSIGCTFAYVKKE